jgi:hypothetical protein
MENPTPIRPMYQGYYGYPVLIKVNPEYSLLGDRNLTLAMPVNEFFGAKTYFFGDDLVLTNSCGVIEYDCETEGPFASVKGRHTSFIEATEQDILTALEDPKCTPYFKTLVLEIMENLQPLIDLKNECELNGFESQNC